MSHTIESNGDKSNGDRTQQFTLWELLGAMVLVSLAASVGRQFGMAAVVAMMTLTWPVAMVLHKNRRAWLLNDLLWGAVVPALGFIGFGIQSAEIVFNMLGSVEFGIFFVGPTAALVIERLGWARDPQPRGWLMGMMIVGCLAWGGALAPLVSSFTHKNDLGPLVICVLSLWLIVAVYVRVLLGKWRVDDTVARWDARCCVMAVMACLMLLVILPRAI